SRRARAPGGASRRGASVEHRTAGGLAPPLSDLRPGCQARGRQGARRLPRGAGVRGRARQEMSSRVDTLRASLEEPLLVTNPTNVLYLVGFKSSNAALFVEPDRLRLF